VFYIEYLFRRFTNISDKKEVIPVYFNFGLIGLIGLVFPFIGYYFLKDLSGVPWPWFVVLSIMLFLIGIFICLQLIQKKIERVFCATILFIVSIICFGMPLSKVAFQNNDYKSFTQLKKWEEKNNIPVYEFAYFTPEIIWEYGSSIPVIFNQNQTILLPKEKTFAVLVGLNKEQELKETFKEYTIEKITRYDINPSKMSEKGYNGRLWRDLFLVSTK
jgi:hypothetical protein